jgi:putative nucleotidyltransferase with HDIG domain
MEIDFHSFIRSIMKTIEVKDIYTAGHSDRVADIAERIAIEMKIPANEIELIHVAAHLHDIGKIGIPDGILMKTGKLNQEEYSLMKNHSIIGWEILSEIDNFQEVASYVRHHHERPDGKGYPDGLTEKEIPRGAAIISVADAFDAMTSQRTYKKSLSMHQAIEEVNLLINEQFAEIAVYGFNLVMKKEDLLWEV